MGSTVLSSHTARAASATPADAGARVGAQGDDGVRVFAHCTSGSANGSVTLAMLNPSAASVILAASRNSTSSASSTFANGADAERDESTLVLMPRVEFILTSAAGASLPRESRMRSRQVQLNGAGGPLSGADPLLGKRVDDVGPASAAPPLVLPPYSYGFVVLPDVLHPDCMHQ